MSNITGHGWRKLMRADRELSYDIDSIPEPQPVFRFMQEKSGNDDREMYGNCNMGAGFALFVSPSQIEPALGVLAEQGYDHTLAGIVEEGPKQVVIRPKDLVYAGESLAVR
jgi:phosphoribosylformylglycinamidine cyclo-ligase